jgi:hypothetical protein
MISFVLALVPLLVLLAALLTGRYPGEARLSWVRARGWWQARPGAQPPRSILASQVPRPCGRRLGGGIRGRSPPSRFA